MPSLTAYRMSYDALSRRCQEEMLSHSSASPLRLTLCYFDSSICLVGRTGIITRFDRVPLVSVSFAEPVVLDVAVSAEGYRHMAKQLGGEYDDIYELFDAFWDHFIDIEDVEDVVFP